MDALADATRLRLLRLLERHELGVADLCQTLQMPQSTVSRHLKLLLDGGWLTHRRAGTASLYRMLLDELDDPARQLWIIAREQIAQTAQYKQDQLRLFETLRQRRERDRDAQQFFAGAASDWDNRRTELYGQSFVNVAMLSLLPDAWTVADLGCGTGPMLVDMAPHVAHVIGIDQSDAMLQAASKRIESSSLTNIELHRGDMEALPLPDDHCDAAMMTLALSYVTDPAAALSEMCRVIKPNGRAIITDLLRHDRDDFRRQMNQACNGFDIDELTDLLVTAGFTLQTCRPLPPEKNAKGPALLLAVATKK